MGVPCGSRCPEGKDCGTEVCGAEAGQPQYEDECRLVGVLVGLKSLSLLLNTTSCYNFGPTFHTGLIIKI